MLSHFFRVTLFVLAGAVLFAQDTGPSTAGGPTGSSGPELDFLYFKERVQPIFLQKRLGHARCVECHTHRAPPLEPLTAGAETWNDEQSRKNFDMWKLFVVPGKPMESRFLLHPLAMDAGGDHFHGGGKHWKSQADPEWQTLAGWVRGQKLGGMAMPSTSGVVRVLQSNSAGDNVHLIDPATDEIVGLIEDVDVPHGLITSPDGKRIYITDESRTTLDVVDVKTLKVFKRIPLSGRPNNVDVAKDGSKVYVGIREAPGAVDVIDATSLTNVNSIPVKGAIHNVYVSPDGSMLFAGSIDSKTLNVVDLTREALSWSLTMDGGIRPMALMKNGEGSTKWIIVQLSDFHGFAVVDFATRKEIKRVEFPDAPGKEREMEGLQGSPAHGLALSPDQKVLWSTSKYFGAVYAYGVPQSCNEQKGCEWKLLKIVEVGSHPDWLAMTPDGTKLYVALAGDDVTAVIDTESMTVTENIAVGNVPKRVIAATLSTR